MSKDHALAPIAALLIVVIAVLGCGKLSDFVKKDTNSTAVSSEEKKFVDAALKIDVRNSPPSPGAEILRMLASLDPSVARFGSRVEAAERTVIQKSIADVPSDSKKNKVQETSFAPLDHGVRFGDTVARQSGPAMLMMLQASTAESTSNRSSGAALVGAIVARLKEIFTEGHTRAVAGGVKGSKTEVKDGVKTTMGVELMYREDGSSAFGIQLDTEATDKDGSKVTTQMSGRIDGTDCPNAEGQVPITAKLRIGGESGGTGYTQDVEAFIRTSVDDEANTTTTTIDFVQGTREVLKGDDIYVETGFTGTFRDGKYEESNWRLIRHSQSAGADVPKSQAIAAGGQELARSVALTILAMAERKWQNGGCVAIEAKSPGNVEPSSVTEIPVSVKHKFDGSSVPSKVRVELAGETSVSPMQIDQTPGKLSYTAPAEKNKSATIKLEARSKRGRAKLDLNATTGGNAYSISGSIDEASMSGTTCDSSQPFSIGGTLSFQFTPTSPTTGTYRYSGPYSAKGSGPYVINDDGSMKLDGTGCIMGGGCATYSHVWRAEKIDPSTCGK